MTARIFGISVVNQSDAAMQQAPVTITVCGAPMRCASAPASKLPNGAAPKKAIV